MEYITIPITKVPVIMKADVVVVGGGPAGVGAAVRAAQHGADTVIIERFGSLGGITTNGFMFSTVRYLGLLPAEIVDRLKPGGYVVEVAEKFPEINSQALLHSRTYSGTPMRTLPPHRFAYDPGMLSCVMNDMMEESSVKFLLRSLFVDTKVEGDTIKAVIVENASGRQAIEGKVFVDATGRGDVVARAGCPYTGPANEFGLPMPPGLMWKMSDVDIDKLFEYEKKDPGLDMITEKAKAKGELPYYRPKKTVAEMKYIDRQYSGHPRLEMTPVVYPGDILLWAPLPYEWGLNCAEKAEDLTRAEIHVRKEIVSELSFLKKYVPGFEKAHLSGIAPMMGIRQGRHPIGEYVMSYEDFENGHKFDDVALRRRVILQPCAGADGTTRLYEIEYPYRCFLAKKIDNLLLAGDNLSLKHPAFLFSRGFGIAMVLGEVAGTAAALSVKNEVKPKELKFEPLEVEG